MIGIAGAGLSGAVIAHQLACRGFPVTVFDPRPHVAGNCHTERDAETGVLLHVFGPHIFHTDDASVWNFVRRFDEFLPFTNRVKAVHRGRIYPLPINLMTINMFFGKALAPREAQALLASLGDPSIVEPRSFEEQALRFLGRELYEAFFRGYTRKQWGLEPRELPASILKRLPVRFDYDDNYYTSAFQGMPRHGYTRIVERMLDHPLITVRLGEPLRRSAADRFEHVFNTGPIDDWFERAEGRLGYRTLDFVVERHDGDYQGNAIVNYCDEDVPWTRITEHKHFAPWENHARTVIHKEQSRICGDGDTPFYPIRLLAEKSMLSRYVTLASRERRTTFVGRLGTYRYLDMDRAIAEAFDAADRFVKCRAEGSSPPAFLVDVL